MHYDTIIEYCTIPYGIPGYLAAGTCCVRTHAYVCFICSSQTCLHAASDPHRTILISYHITPSHIHRTQYNTHTHHTQEPLTPSSPAISHLPLDLDITDFDLDITLDDAAYLYTLATYPPSPFDIDLRDLGLDVDLDLALIPSLLPLPAEYIPTLLPLPMQMAMHMHMDMFPLPGGNVHPIHTHTQSYIQTHTHTHTNSHPPPPYSHADANIGSSSGGGGSSGNNMESNTMTPNNPTDHRIAALQQAIRDGTVTANQTRNVQRVIADLRDGVEWSLYQDGVRVTHETRNFSRLLWKEAVTGAAVAAA
ncbi:hypothetical protein Dda_7513 [Drechslerella dactyloides]|uniref:Uncharacterized protein n=1 Tax=Drechslerella dactyloides TaxID=74499 RepID=A0AAD6NGS6_DREDA|nr:hypothetical protein Dda_7513 [Drechslerella dactyloides]